MKIKEIPNGWKVSVIFLTFLLWASLSFAEEVLKKSPLAYLPSGEVMHETLQSGSGIPIDQPYAKDHVIVRFKEGVSSTAITATHAKIQTLKVKKFNLVKNLHLV
jgi:hypothetical protein